MLALVACSENLFGSPGESKCGNSKECLLIDAESYFQAREYKKAYEAYSKIVALDSSASVGYYGMAKADLWNRGIDPISIFVDVKPKNDDKYPFASDPAFIKNKYLQGFKSMVEILSPLDRRDSLTFLYKYHQKDSLSRATGRGGFDTTFTITKTEVIDGKSKITSETVDLPARLKVFRDVFCGGSSTGTCVDNVSSNPKKDFPLSDMEYSADYYGNILRLASITKNFLLVLFDFNNDGCIAVSGNDEDKDGNRLNNPGDPIKDAKKWLEWGCERKFTNGSYYDDDNIFGDLFNLISSGDGNMPDLGEFLDNIGLDDDFFESLVDNPNQELPPSVNDLNNKLNEMTDSFEEMIDVLTAMGVGSGDDIDDSENWADSLEKYKDYSVFYRVGTHIDEDGDGCIDEDMLDKYDNDGDGLKSANARIASTDLNSPFWGKSGINHSMKGDPKNRDDINHERNMPMLLPAPVFISNKKGVTAEECKASFYADNFNDEDCTILEGDEENGLVTVIGFTQEPGYWTSKDLDLKLEVARDTVCGELKYSREERIELIGGCWSNYDDEKFIKYWLKRELAREEDQKTRVHENCKNCEGEACLKKK
jgi:hypothetical protein